MLTLSSGSIGRRGRIGRHVPLSSVAGLAVLVLFVAACGSAQPTVSPSAGASVAATAGASVAATGAPSASPSSSVATSAAPSGSPAADVDAIYNAIEAQVIEIRGLKPTRPVDRQFIDESQLRTLITQQFDAETPPAYLAANERLYKALGLIPIDAKLRDLTLDLLSGGVAGFYRSDQNKLYVVSKTGTPGVIERFTFAHEYDHALQDQNYTVFKDQVGVRDQSDRLLARQAVYEGDATLVMTQWAVKALSPQDLTELVALSADPANAALLARMPPILRETLLYPYTTGFSYVQRAQSSGGWAAVNKLYERMPVSTEQILHPEKYAASEAPVKVSLPADLATRLGKGWTVSLEDTFGELQMGIWLAAGSPATAASTAAAAGWGGDRLAVMEGPHGAWAVVMHTVWDTDQDATEFETAATRALRQAHGTSRIVPGEGGRHRWIVVADRAATLRTVQNVLGLAG